MGTDRRTKIDLKPGFEEMLEDEYASYFRLTKNQKWAERQIGELLYRFLRRNEVIPKCEVRTNQSDPPDLFFESKNGLRIGVEVTELVDGAFIQQAKYWRDRGEYFWKTANWTPKKLRGKILDIVAVKQGKLKDSRVVVHENYLVIFSDETSITPEILEQSVENFEFEIGPFNRVIFVLGYHPETDQKKFPDRCYVRELLND